MRERWEFNWAELDIRNGLIGDPNSPHRETINERGARGWELVAVVDNGEVGPGRRYLAFFKRRVRTEA